MVDSTIVTDPLLLEALREVDRIAPAAPNVAPPEEFPAPEGAHRPPTSAVRYQVCLLSDLVDEVDCPHCMEERSRRIQARIARANGWS